MFVRVLHQPTFVKDKLGLKESICVVWDVNNGDIVYRGPMVCGDSFYDMMQCRPSRNCSLFSYLSARARAHTHTHMLASILRVHHWTRRE